MSKYISGLGDIRSERSLQISKRHASKIFQEDKSGRLTATHLICSLNSFPANRILSCISYWILEGRRASASPSLAIAFVIAVL
jgi:hypothetical protein